MATNPTTDLLASLHDIEFVAAEGSNIPGIGWWISALVLLLLIASCIYYCRRFTQKNRYRKIALSLLQQASLKEQSDSDKLLAYNAIIKRAALTALPDTPIDKLYGKQWLMFLNKYTSKPVFSEALAESWHQGQFRKHAVVDTDEFYKSCKHWLKLHKTYRKAVSHV